MIEKEEREEAEAMITNNLRRTIMVAIIVEKSILSLVMASLPFLSAVAADRRAIPQTTAQQHRIAAWPPLQVVFAPLPSVSPSPAVRHTNHIQEDNNDTWNCNSETPAPVCQLFFFFLSSSYFLFSLIPLSSLFLFILCSFFTPLFLRYAPVFVL